MTAELTGNTLAAHIAGVEFFRNPSRALVYVAKIGASFSISNTRKRALARTSELRAGGPNAGVTYTKQFSAAG
jgi:hypothetical protein